MNYPKLFQKGKIGRLTIKNRTVMTAMGVGLANPTVYYDLLSRFSKYDPVLMPGQRLTKITDTGVLLTAVEGGKETLVEADTVVLALGVSPRKGFVEQFEEVFSNVKVVGDASRGGRIAEAVSDGYTKAYVL